MNHLTGSSNWITPAVLAGLAFFAPNPSRAQTVSTFLTGSGLNGPDGFSLDGAENIFVSECNANRIRRITGVEPAAAGQHAVSFDASGLSGGTYFCRLTSGSSQQTKKLVVVGGVVVGGAH